MRRHIPILLGVAAVLLTLLFWFLLYQPARDAQAQTEAETLQLEGQRGDLQAQIATLEEVRDNEDDFRSRLERLVDYIPDDPSQPQALRELQRAADEAGVEILELTFAEPELAPEGTETGDDSTVLARVPLQLRVGGAYFQVVDLLRRIEVDLARAVRIETVELAEDEDLGLPDLSVTGNGYLYAVMPADEVSGPDGQPVVPEPEASEGASEGASEAPSDAPQDGGAPADAPPADGSTTTGTS